MRNLVGGGKGKGARKKKCAFIPWMCVCNVSAYNCVIREHIISFIRRLFSHGFMGKRDCTYIATLWLNKKILLHLNNTIQYLISLLSQQMFLIIAFEIGNACFQHRLHTNIFYTLQMQLGTGSSYEQMLICDCTRR